ncbi:MAG: isoprenyl transferase [Liquorilactobacillus hordei]|uniref:isoprenyl transferase n=1 Tax=Liquorilactobacillus hordei TaxID=468911 RepID=UPI0039E8D82C
MFSKFIKNNNVLRETVQKIDETRIPQHIAIIMDGNGRWAQKRHLPRIAGHKSALTTVKEITKAASNFGVKVLTLYTFSTENWKRPKKEVEFLMSLPITFFDTFVPELIENNIQVNAMGELNELPAETLAAVNRAIAQTSHCTGMILNFAINYGGRDEIVAAVRTLAMKVQKRELVADSIDESLISDTLMTSNLKKLANPDLLIRTSGEQRISNFLLWQLAYSEFIFSDVLWPDYTPEDLCENIIEYQKRDRRFGGLKKG